MDIIIREADKADLPQILELYKELQPQDLPIDIDAATAVWEQLPARGVVHFVAEMNGRVVADCYVAVILNLSKQCRPIGFIENVVTAAAYRRMGIGRKLLETAIAYAKAQGCYKVMLQSGMKRTEAHRFYESLGFDGNSKRAFQIRF